MSSPFWKRWWNRDQHQARPQRPSTRPQVEALEDRQLLAAGLNTFARWTGETSRAGEMDQLQLTILPSDFTMPRGAAIMG